MSKIYNELKQRGFIKQETAPVEIFNQKTHQLVETISLESQLDNGKITYYVGFDPTADSLHVGHLLPIMAMSHLQKAGHIPICIIGGGTTMIGDPTGKTQMRQILSKEEIESNGKMLLQQLKRYISFDNDQGLFLNNADWLLPLNYINFLRDIGKHFRVNHMLKSEAYKMRLDRNDGLSFIEFNYQILQAYDFLFLYEKYGCSIQMGGDDQWSNILAGIDLIHKVKQGNSHALTFPLLVTAKGQKMGKTESGAVWLDSKKTSPFEYYQFWINTDDRDVEKFLKLFTFLPFERISELCNKIGDNFKSAKECLALEATTITHGIEEAEKAQTASRNLFGSERGNTSNIPNTSITELESQQLKLSEVLVKAKLCSSKTEAVKLIKSSGIYIDNKAFTDATASLLQVAGTENTLLIRKGKKTYHKITIV